MLGERLGTWVEVHKGFSIGPIAGVDDEWIEMWSLFNRKNPRYSPIVQGIGAEPINRLGRKDDDFSLQQTTSCLCHVPCVGGQNPRDGRAIAVHLSPKLKPLPQR